MLTPEEWVRQNVLLYLTKTLGYPLSLVAVERQIMVGKMKKRFDVLLYDRSAKPFMVIECKEMGEILTEQVIMQALRYNMTLQAPFVAVTNGLHCAACQLLGDQPKWIKALPAFE